MNLSDTLDILNTPGVGLSLWQDASDLLMAHGLGWSFSRTSNRFLLVDLATQWGSDIPDASTVEPIGSAEQVSFDWIEV